MSKKITVWQDRDDADRPWIVSIDTPSGTDTIGVFATKAEADAFAASDAAQRKLAAV